jgi:tetratricopeptide (TPR) repeat protein
MSLYDDAMEAFRTGDDERARELAEELVRSGEQIDGLCMLARVALREGDTDRVRELASEARRLATDEASERMPLHLQAAGARVAGELDEARRLYLESIDLNSRLDTDFVAAELHNLAFVELHAGDLARAKELFAQAEAEAQARGYEGLLPYLVLDRGIVAVEEGHAELGLRLLGAGQAAFETKGEKIDPDDQAEVDRALEKARSSLDAEAVRRANEDGRAMSVEEALA